MPKKIACLHNCPNCSSKDFSYNIKDSLIIGTCQDCSYTVIIDTKEKGDKDNVFDRGDKFGKE